MSSHLLLLFRLTQVYHTNVTSFTVGVECRARNAAPKYVAATKNIFRAYHTETALTKTSAAIHAPPQKRLRLKTRRVSRWRMLKIIVWRKRG